MSGAAFEGASRPGRDVVGYTTSVRFLYFGLPLGAEVLRRAGFVPHVASFGHRMSGLRRVRARLAPLVVATDRTSAPLATERPLLLFKPDLNDRGIVQALASARPDAILSWFWPTQIPPAVLSLAPRGAFGVHPSLLPRHRGPDPYFHAIREGDAETGVTLHRLEAAYDTGHVVAQRRVPIDARDDSRASSIAPRSRCSSSARSASRGARRSRASPKTSPSRPRHRSPPRRSSASTGTRAPTRSCASCVRPHLRRW
jgi:folate-dependent phosphoribosylglycinamide formyltransferase PurN